jgi:hypothetical protein
VNKFTDGPWSLETYEGDPRYAEHYVKAGDHMVAIVSAANHGEWRNAEDEGESEFIANAKLIAASPLMIEALQKIQFRCECFLEDERSMSLSSIEAIKAICDEVISKAI